MNTDKVTRVEVIDYTKPFEHGGGRAYTFWEEYDQMDIKNPVVSIELQDSGRTLKVFISSPINEDDKREIEDAVADQRVERIH